MGWKRTIAAAAVKEAARALGDGVALERFIVEALRRCPRPVRLSAGLAQILSQNVPSDV